MILDLKYFQIYLTHLLDFQDTHSVFWYGLLTKNL